MKKILTFFKNNTSITVAFIIFFSIAIFNSFMNIGLIEDGCHHFLDALAKDHFIVGHDFSRYFPSILSHLSVATPILLGIKSIKVLLFIFTFVSYIEPILLLTIVYINIPKDKKYFFEIPLLYFVSCMFFLIHFIWTENFMTGLFLWNIFVIYYYVDFKKLTKTNLVSLIIFSICLISSHPMTAIFTIPIIIFALIKQYLTKDIPIFSKIILILSYIFLLSAFIFNLYFIIHPICSGDGDYSIHNLLKNKNFFYFLSLILVFILTSIINTKLKFIKIVIYISITIICCKILFNISSYDGFENRIIGFYLPLFLMSFILIKDLFNLKISYNHIKIINIIFMLLFLVLSVNYSYSWKKNLKSINNYILNNEVISYQQIQNSYHLFHKQNIPYIYLFIPLLFDNNSNCKLIFTNLEYKSIESMEIKEESLKPNKNLLKLNIDARKRILIL